MKFSFFSGISPFLRSAAQSQRDCVLQPKVARNELPWERLSPPPQPRWGCDFLPSLTRGSSFLATPGFEPESLWDSWTATSALPASGMRPSCSCGAVSSRTMKRKITNWLGCLLASFSICLLSWGATAETTNTLSNAEIQGRQLARQLLEQRPAENFTNAGILIIRSPNVRTNIPITIVIYVGVTNWTCYYTSPLDNGGRRTITIIHDLNLPESYRCRDFYSDWKIADYPLAGTNQFLGSDFFIGDLGLEFFHWPQQKVLPKTTNLKRGREYTLLESTNPNPSTNGYSRVLSWIDKESGGILEAEAYDFNGKLLKDFAPKSFKKVNGQWQLQEMEIRNVQTGSRTRLEFDLKQE